VEENAEADTEYTIRVERNEKDVPHLIVGLNNQNNVKLRLKGTKDGPWTLEPEENDRHVTAIGGASIKANTESIAFINIGPNNTSDIARTFILGKNVTIKSKTIPEGNWSSGGPEMMGVFSVGMNATLVLEPGSKITGHDSTAVEGIMSTVIYISSTNKNTARDPTKHGSLHIKGGEITDCKVRVESTQLIYTSWQETCYEFGAISVEGNNVLKLSNNNNYNIRFRADSGSANKTYDLLQYLESGLTKP
jgi:hypothetical protein